MSTLNKVTITGADDNTNVSDMVTLSKAFPFVEWGILVSEKRQGAPRFPSRGWISFFAGQAAIHGMNVSTHICGKWVRDLYVGELDFNTLPDCIYPSKRVQINTHGERHVSTAGYLRNLVQNSDKTFIFQLDGVNDHLMYAARAEGLSIAGLYDLSHGAGHTPLRWPYSRIGYDCGYAGGLGPVNVLEQLGKIESVADRDYWIDMEKNVRSEYGDTLDLGKVARVLSITKLFKGQSE